MPTHQHARAAPGRGPRNLCRVAPCIVLCALWLSGTALASGSTDSAAEYELKAALLRQLLNYVEWPSNAPSQVCVVGEDPFGATLDRAFGPLRPRLRRLSANSAELPACGLVFVAASEAPVTRLLLDRLRNIGTLSVSDQPNFTEQGGMIAMRMQERRVKFRIDVEHTRRAGLRVNAKLLRLSDLVGSDRVPAP